MGVRNVNKIVSKYAIDTIYEFDLTGEIKFGILSADELYTMFKDGRTASKFIEHIIPHWFPELLFVDKAGYDHTNMLTERKYDLKGFTKGGANYAPSTMVGSGRSVDETKLHKHANSIDYIFSDLTKFPVVRIIVKSGQELVKNYPTGKIPFNMRDELFKEKIVTNE